MSTPTDSSPDELRALRERAYGPGADIHADPAALARLNELEEQAALARAARNGHTPDAAAEVLPSAEEDAPTEAETPAHRAAPGEGAVPFRIDEPAAMDAGTTGPSDEGNPDPDPVDPERVQPWWRRRIPVLWAMVSVGVALLIGIGLTLGIQAAETGRIAVLAEEPDAEWPEAFFGSRPANGRVFEEFHGLTVVSFPQTFDESGAQTCLYVLTSPGGNGFGAGSCGAGSFPATASLEVVSLSPRELRERFPDGTALQFVLEESGVHVYAREPGIVEPTP